MRLSPRSSTPSSHSLTDWSLLAAAILTRRLNSGSTSTDNLTLATTTSNVSMCPRVF